MFSCPRVTEGNTEPEVILLSNGIQKDNCIPKILDAIILKMGISFNYMYVKYFSPDKFSGVLANIKEQFRILPQIYL